MKDDDSSGKEAKDAKKCIVKPELKITKKKKAKMLKSKQRFKCNAHNVLAEKLNKISLRFNDQKTLQSLIGVKSYSY